MLEDQLSCRLIPKVETFIESPKEEIRVDERRLT
jgi:hypothetical protein